MMPELHVIRLATPEIHLVSNPVDIILDLDIFCM